MAITIDNVVTLADTDPETIVAEMDEIIFNYNFEIPAHCVSREDVLNCQTLQSYYAGMYSYLTQLWGMMRVTAGNDKQRIAVRDYLEKVGSACKLKYEAASRLLTGFLTLLDGDKDARQV